MEKKTHDSSFQVMPVLSFLLRLARVITSSLKYFISLIQSTDFRIAVNGMMGVLYFLYLFLSLSKLTEGMALYSDLQIAL
jgi:Ni,Fe-hydrogenase I cytochrome b subunit